MTSAVLIQQGSFYLKVEERVIDYDSLEKRLLIAALEEYRGNQQAAARALAITRDQLRYRMAKYKLPDYRRIPRPMPELEPGQEAKSA